MNTAKNRATDLSFVSWGVSDLKKEAEGILNTKKGELEKIKRVPKEKRNFKNTILALEASDYELSDRLGRIDFLMYVSPNKALRDEAEKISVSIRKELLPLEYDRDIWKAIKEFKQKKEKLVGAEAKLFKDYYLDYKRKGFDLPEKEFNRLLEINRELTDLSVRFEKNINEHKDRILIDEKETAGLPDTYLKTLKREGGKYVVTLSYPDYFPFMEYAESEKRRKEISEKYYTRAAKVNTPIMRKILALRYEGAKLLGYKDPASFILEMKMAKKVDTVMRFLEELMQKMKEGVKSDLKMLAQEKKNRTGNKKDVLQTHDTSYYSRLLKERIVGLDKEEIKKHFKFDVVKSGVFEVYSKLLSVTFREEKEKGWHQDVSLYSIIDGKGVVRAQFFMDMFPREGKYGHAAAFSIIQGRKEDRRYISPVSALVMNVPRPQKDQPSLLTHGEVETFFHEFGHIMHQCLTTAPYMSQSGTSVARDFVEAPSQIFENWAWQPDILRKITSHLETGRPMPEEMIQKLISSRNFLEPLFTARQLVFGFFDMAIHTKIPKSINDVYIKYWNKLVGIALPKNSNYPAAFGHFVGYQAGYYGYLWSAVYAADMFSIFLEKGILNPVVGNRYRREILERGSSRDEMDSLIAFLGRRPNNRAFLRDLGLR